MATLSSHPAPRSSKPQLASDRGSNVAGAPYDRPRRKGPCNNEVRTALCSMGLARQVEGTHVAAPTKSPPSLGHAHQAPQVRTKGVLHVLTHRMSIIQERFSPTSNPA